ncbi:Shikimate dehydrogenase (NADP(+)) [Bienertia sinuspersici]
MAAIAPPNIHHYHSFNHYSLTPTSAFSPLKLTVFKAHSSLRTNNNNLNQYSHHYSASLTISSSHSKKLTHLPSKTTCDSDPELRAVLELATSSELFEIEGILFGPSYLSPLLKSINSGVEFDRFMIEQDFEEREHFIDVLESRFLYLAADARSILRGWRPSYKNVLLDVRKQLEVPCSTKLSTEDLEAEVFIHLLGECSRNWDTVGSVRAGTAELCSVLLKGGQLISLLKISELVSTKLSGKMLFETAKHKVDDEVKKVRANTLADLFCELDRLFSILPQPSALMWI